MIRCSSFWNSSVLFTSDSMPSLKYQKYPLPLFKTSSPQEKVSKLCSSWNFSIFALPNFKDKLFAQLLEVLYRVTGVHRYFYVLCSDSFICLLPCPSLCLLGQGLRTLHNLYPAGLQMLLDDLLPLQLIPKPTESVHNQQVNMAGNSATKEFNQIHERNRL